MSFLEEFDENYSRKLAHRAKTMQYAFSELYNRKEESYLIVETGCVRKVEGDGRIYGPQVPSAHPWYPTGWHGPWADGMSTILFDKFVNATSGTVFSVDINPDNCAVAQSHLSSRSSVTCSDSVLFLANFYKMREVREIDLLYLDSYDLDWDNPHDSALHHLKELATVYSSLKPGCLILVDDCYDASGRQGKGKYVEEFFAQLSRPPIVSGYQMLWIK